MKREKCFSKEDVNKRKKEKQKKRKHWKKEREKTTHEKKKMNCEEKRKKEKKQFKKSKNKEKFKNAKSQKISQVFWFHTQKSSTIPWFAIVVVSSFDEIFDDFRNLFRNVFCSLRKSTTHFGVSPFFQRVSDNIHWTWNKHNHTLPTKINEHFFAKVRSSDNNYSFRIINHSTTTTTTVNIFDLAWFRCDGT